nr:hypothetical protein [Bacillota bacterium]
MENHSSTARTSNPVRTLLSVIVVVLAALLYLALLVNLFFACSSAWSGGGCIKDIGSSVEEAWYESKECGWPLTYYLETKEGCFEQAKRTSDWQITGLVADGLLCLALAIALYWLVRSFISAMRRWLP